MERSERLDPDLLPEPEDPFQDQPMLIMMSDDMLRRRFAWDMVPDTMVMETIQHLGMDVGSPEVENAEHQGAIKRLMEIQPIAPAVHYFSHLMADVFRAGMLVLHDDDEDVDEFYDKEHLMMVMSPILTACITELVDIGALSPGKRAMTVG